MAGDGYETHRVDQGEDIISIAEQYRASAEAIWNDGANAKLRELRKNPFVLFPGDELQIPPLKPKRVAIRTDKRHTFHRKGLREKLILYLMHNDQPRAGVRYLLEVEKRQMPGVTDGNGKIEHPLFPADRVGVLHVQGDPPPGVKAPEIYELRLGHLDPVDTGTGLRARLVNLGFLDNFDAAEDELPEALSAFQEHWKLRVTGRADTKTRDKLLEIHQS